MVGSRRLVALAVVVTLGALAGCSIEAVRSPATVSGPAPVSYVPPPPPEPQTKVLADGPVSLTTTNSPADVGISRWDGFGMSQWAVGDLVVGEFEVNPSDETPQRVQAVDGKTGETRWYIDGVDTLMSSITDDTSPLITRDDGGVTLIATWLAWDRGTGVFAVDVASGEMLWHTTVLPDHRSSANYVVVTRDAAVVYDALGGPAVALDAATGEELWSMPQVYMVSAGADNVVVVKVEDYDSPPVAFDSRTGAELWRDTESFGAGFEVSYADADAIVLSGYREDESGRDYRVVFYDAQTGQIKGTFEYGSHCFRGEPRVLACGGNDVLYGVSMDTGEVLWEIDHSEDEYHAPVDPTAAAGPYLYVTDLEGHTDSSVGGLIDIASGEYLGDLLRAPFAVGNGFGLVWGESADWTASEAS